MGTNLELLKSLPRRRRVNFGKKRSFLKKKTAKKNPIPSHTEKSFTISILKKKKSPLLLLHIGFVCHLYQTQLSVYLTKNNIQQQKNQQTYKKQQKNTFYLIPSLFFWTLYNNSVFTISYFTSVLHYSLLFS